MPLKAWIKSALDHVVQACLSEPDLEFVWVGDDAVDPLQQAQTLNILVGAGIKTIAEARAELGLAAEAKATPGLGKYNQNHDEVGRFTDAAHAVEPGASGATKPKGVQVAANDDAKTKSGAGALNVRITSANDVSAAVSRKVAYPEGWQACHEKCLAETEGVWPPSDRPGLYRRCVRACLGPAGDDY